MELVLFLVGGFIFLVLVAVGLGLQQGSQSQGSESQPTRTRERSRTSYGQGPPRQSHGDEAGSITVQISFPGNDLSSQMAYRAYEEPSPATCRTQSHRCWVPAGKAVEIQGFQIPGGLLYTGKKLAGLPGSYAQSDPALINPDLTVSSSGGRGDAEMTYWPSYSDVSPSCRHAYLTWLAGGRADPEINVGYVFLYFYGLERRVLFDAEEMESAVEDVPAIIAEVERLLDLYEDNHSFQGYAVSFLDYISLKFDQPSSRGLYGGHLKVSWRMPAGLKIELGKLVEEKRPIPDLWALSWFLHHPETHLRTPGRRCRNEFRDLFLFRYRQSYGEGMKVRPPKKRLTIDYRAASASLRGVYEAEAPDLPDVESLTAPLKKLQQIADSVQDALDSYSRWVGRYEEGQSLEALALLPAELVPDRLSEDQRAILTPIDRRLAEAEEEGIALVPVAELIEHWPTKKRGKLYKGEARKLADFLASLGYGTEPDPRYGGPNPGRYESLAVYRLQEADEEPGEPYAWATLLLHLGAAVASADEDFSMDEERLLESHLEESLDLPARDRLRLRAHLRWLSSEPPDFRGIKDRTIGLPDEERDRIARFLLSIAAADGRLDAQELSMLEKIYPILGLEANEVHSQLHSLAATDGPAESPVTVQSGEPFQEFAIPGPPGDEESVEVLRLDRERIAAIQNESRKAAGLLHDIFSEEEEETEEEQSTSGPEVDSTLHPATQDPFTQLRLAEGQSQLLRLLLGRPSWPREEVESLARDQGVMAGGSIEIINERSFELWDEPLLEGVDPIDVNEYLVEEYFSEEAQQ